MVGPAWVGRWAQPKQSRTQVLQRRLDGTSSCRQRSLLNSAQHVQASLWTWWLDWLGAAGCFLTRNIVKSSAKIMPEECLKHRHT